MRPPSAPPPRPAPALGPSFPAGSSPRLPRSAARLLVPAPAGSAPGPSRWAGALPLARPSPPPRWMFAFAAFGQRNLFTATGSGAKGLAGRLAMEAAARRRHPGAAGGSGAQPGASFLQARWARAGGRSGTAAPPRDREGGGSGPRAVDRGPRTPGGSSQRYACSCFLAHSLEPRLRGFLGEPRDPGSLSHGDQRPSWPGWLRDDRSSGIQEARNGGGGGKPRGHCCSNRAPKAPASPGHQPKFSESF